MLIPRMSLSAERPTTIHRHACENCPSAHLPPDPEAKDMRTWTKSDRIETVFPCAWRPQRMCKGYCDYMEITEKDLQEASHD